VPETVFLVPTPRQRGVVAAHTARAGTRRKRPGGAGGARPGAVARGVPRGVQRAGVDAAVSAGMFFGFNVFDPRESPAVSAGQESYKSGFTGLS
jgi:hypothetical protein